MGFASGFSDQLCHHCLRNKTWRRGVLLLAVSLVTLIFISRRDFINMSIKPPYFSVRKLMISPCKSVNADKLENVKTTSRQIPFILHRIRKETFIPKIYVEMIEKCNTVNREFIQVMWTEQDGEKFVKEKYPHLYGIYRRYTASVEKLNFIRVLVLYHFGGVYLHMDVECRKPFSTALDSFPASALLDQEASLQTRLLYGREVTAKTSVMVSRKNHPFFKYLLDQIPANVDGGTSSWKNGPFFLTARYTEYNKKKRDPEDAVLMVPHQTFSPLLDPLAYEVFFRRCEGKSKTFPKLLREGCNSWRRKESKVHFVREMTENSVAVHWWLAGMYEDLMKHVTPFVDTCTAVSNLYQFAN